MLRLASVMVLCISLILQIISCSEENRVCGVCENAGVQVLDPIL